MLTEPRIDWPENVKRGDLAQSVLTLEFAQVDRITGPHDDSGMGAYYLIRFGSRADRRNRNRDEMFLASMPIIVIRHELCATPACEFHVMERGDERFICAYHWSIVQTSTVEIV